jgi:hypothetical protein
VIVQPQRFFSSSATRAEDGAVSIALFNGDGTCVGIFSGSVDAAINLIADIAGCLRSENGSAASDGR